MQLIPLQVKPAYFKKIFKKKPDKIYQVFFEINFLSVLDKRAAARYYF